MNRTELLCALLNCGSDDISILDGIGYDIHHLVNQCNERVGVSLESLIRTAVDLCVAEVNTYISERFEELVELKRTDRLTAAEKEELGALAKMDPTEDISLSWNYLDTAVRFECNADLYQTYLRDELDYFYRMTGFEIEE